MDDGMVGVLNVGAGDTKLSFDKNNPVERLRAARIVKDMLRRGYALLIQVDTKDGKQYTRVHDFHEDTCEYIIADFDPGENSYRPDHPPKLTMDTRLDAGVPLRETNCEPQIRRKETPPETKEPQPRQRGRKRRVPAESTHGVAVARTAGG